MAPTIGFGAALASQNVQWKCWTWLTADDEAKDVSRVISCVFCAKFLEISQSERNQRMAWRNKDVSSLL
jgi:hypothetical protein